jgi:hypothetical protein
MFLQSIGIAGSGFNDWLQARKILLGQAALIPPQTEQFRINCLKPNEARRTSTSIKIALQSAESTLAAASFEAAELFSIFVSSDGDPNILQSICQALATEEKFVSPTQFHNSVHNAPAGYWSIGHQAMKGVNSIGCGQCSISGALIEADSLLQTGEDAVLLVCFEIASPSPLDSARAIRHSLAFSLIATRDKTRESLCEMNCRLSAESSASLSRLDDPTLDSLREDNPASMALPLLKALAGNTEKQIVLPYSDSTVVKLELRPC